MGIKFKLVAICDKCGARHEYEADARHDGSPERELLRANEVEHEIELPSGWSMDRRAFTEVLKCLACTRDAHDEAVRNGMPRSGRKA